MANLEHRTPKEMEESLVYRNGIEASHFATGVYRDLDPGILGINKLRARLSDLLYNHLLQELPGLQKELNDYSKENDTALAQLGQSRADIKEQRLYLMELGQKFEKIAHAAISG